MQAIENVAGYAIRVKSDDSLLEAQQKMGTRGLYLLPVVTRERPRQALGVIAAKDIELASDLSLSDRLLHPYIYEPFVTPQAVIPEEP